MFSYEESKHFLTSFVALTLVSPDFFDVHARLKCCDDRFASNPQYIFQSLDWIERTAMAASIHLLIGSNIKVIKCSTTKKSTKR